jgi:hypothetical protein
LKLNRVFAVVLWIGLAGLALVGQNITATLSGTVTDQSGAVVGGATVVAHNNASGQDVRTVKTDASGVYSATLLPPGTYTVTISGAGFQKYVADDVILHVGDHRELNATLNAGAVTQTVTVTATAAPVQSASAAESQTITGHQIRQLELNNRNFEQLVTLQPGVSSQLPALVGFGGISATSNISVNGARQSANNWTVDGADINDSGSNGTILNVPSVDALQEFKIERSDYDAEYGRSSGGQINVVTKSGTNQFHGDAYEFVRNDVLNANDFFLNANNKASNIKDGKAIRPPTRYNDFGYTLGGPIHKDKTFFFWSEEWRRTSTPSTATAFLPSAGEMGGNFTGIATLDPALAPPGCVVGNTISPSCFSTNAKQYIANVFSKYAPNSAGDSLVSAYRSTANTREEILRLDHQLTDKVQLFARYMQDSVPTTEPGGLFLGNPLPGLASTATNAPGRNFVAHMTAIMSPTLVNELAFDYTWGAINSGNTGIIADPAFYHDLNLSAYPYTDPYGRVPGVGFTSAQSLTGVSSPSAPYHERNIDKQLYDNLSWVHGNHTIRTGVLSQFMRKSENGPLATNGNFNFRDTSIKGDTGSMPAFAEFLMGQAYSFTQANRDMIPDLRFTNLETYVQDDWRVRPNLTVNIGVRYSFLPTPMDVTGTLSTFDPSRYNAASAPVIDPKTGRFAPTCSSSVPPPCNPPGAPTPATYLNGVIIGTSGASPYGPATASPYGYYVNNNQKNDFAPRFGFSWDPFNDGKTAVRGGYGVYFDRTLNGIWEQNQFANPPFINTLSLFRSSASSGVSFDNPSNGVPPASILAPRSLHATGTGGFYTPYTQNYNFSLEREIVRNTRLEVAWVGSKGTHLLGIEEENMPTLAARTANPTAAVNAVRPFLGYNAISALATRFDSTYNSLQIGLTRQVATGLNLGVAYTWAKELTDNPSDRSSAPYDTYDVSLDRGPASFIRPQVLVANYVYDLPFFAHQQGAIGNVLGGWEISGITTIESGLPLTMTQFNDPFDPVYPGGIGIDPSVISPRPDLVGPIQVTHVAEPTGYFQWMTKSAWKDAAGHFGTSGRGVLLGPGLDEWDFALLKNFKVGERVGAELRGEFFNFFNHVNPNNPVTAIDSSRFGQITSDYTPRVAQLGLKLNF